MRPLKPALSRALGIAHRVRVDDPATEAALEALLRMREPRGRNGADTTPPPASPVGRVGGRGVSARRSGPNR